MNESMIASAVRYMESIKDKVPPEGEDDIIVKSGTTHMRTLGIDPHEAVKAVGKLQAQGVMVKDACPQVGISLSQYYKTKKGITNSK